MNPRRQDWIWSLVAVLMLFLLSERPAQAYVDPGTASYLFQLLVGGFFAAVYLTRGYWKRLKDFVRARVVRVKPVDE
jgi:hypothetical protein